MKSVFSKEPGTRKGHHSIISHRQQQVFNIYLSAYRLSQVWACSISLFRQHIISFWRSHLSYSQLYCKQQVKNASEMRRDVALGGVGMSALKIVLSYVSVV